MTEPTPYSQATCASLLAKFDEMTLTTAERTLLRDILTVAQEITEVIDPDLDDTSGAEGGAPTFQAEFAAAFTETRAELIRDYVTVDRFPGSIGRLAQPASVGRRRQR